MRAAARLGSCAVVLAAITASRLGGSKRPVIGRRDFRSSRILFGLPKPAVEFVRCRVLQCQSIGALHLCAFVFQSAVAQISIETTVSTCVRRSRFLCRRERTIDRSSCDKFCYVVMDFYYFDVSCVCARVMTSGSRAGAM